MLMNQINEIISMKKIIFTLLLIFPALIYANESQQSGDWEDNNTWVDDAPAYTFGNNVNFIINENHLIETNEDIEIRFQNNATIDVYGTLIINGNIIIDNNLELNIFEDGNLVVNGTLDLKNNGSLDINGELEADNIEGGNNNNLTGNGSVIVHNPDFDCTENFDNCEDSNVVIVIDPLPISLLSFNLTNNDNRVVINWSTATELNNDYFTIEHSTDGQYWDIVSNVSGAGTSNQIRDYELTDENPENGINYYRLKQTDFDGRFEYFAPKVINLNNSKDDSKILNITANQNFIKVYFENTSESARIMVVDIMGRIIYQKEVAGSNQPQELVVDMQGDYSGDILIVNLYSSDSSDNRKIFVR